MSEAPITATVDISDAVSPRLRAAVAKLSDRTGLHKAMAFRVEDRVIENLQAKDQTVLSDKVKNYVQGINPDQVYYGQVEKK